MNTTNEVVIYQVADEQFGKLIELPKIYNDARTSAINARAATDKYLKPWTAVPDIKTADLAALEAIMGPIRTLREKLVTTKKKLNDSRTPNTDKMRAIMTAIIAQENDVESDFQRCKKADDDLQLEILRRNKAAKDAADKKLVDAQAKITRKANIAKVINETFGKDMTAKIVAMHKKFYAFVGGADLTLWVNQMRQYVPVADLKEVQREAVGALDEILEVRATLVEGFKTEYADRLGKERDKIIDMYAGRLRELQSNVPIERTVNVDEFASSVMSAVHAMNQDVDNSAAKAGVDASFDTVTVVHESEGGKGKTVKKKYQCDSIEAFQVIMQSWVKNNMHLLTIDELNTKLSFMRTAANARLNEGQPTLVAKGLTVVDDISTRTTRTKTATA